MCAVTRSQVVFINWQEESAFHAMQLNPLLYFHLSFSCYLLKHVQRALLTSDTVSQQVHFPTVKLLTPTGNKLKPTNNFHGIIFNFSHSLLILSIHNSTVLEQNSLRTLLETKEVQDCKAPKCTQYTCKGEMEMTNLPAPWSSGNPLVHLALEQRWTLESHSYICVCTPGCL